MKHKVHLYAEKLEKGKYYVYLFQSGYINPVNGVRVLHQIDDMTLYSCSCPELREQEIFVNGDDREKDYTIQRVIVNKQILEKQKRLVKEYNERQEN